MKKFRPLKIFQQLLKWTLTTFHNAQEVKKANPTILPNFLNFTPKYPIYNIFLIKENETRQKWSCGCFFFSSHWNISKYLIGSNVWVHVKFYLSTSTENYAHAGCLVLDVTYLSFRSILYYCNIAPREIQSLRKFATRNLLLSFNAVWCKKTYFSVLKICLLQR